MSGAAGGGLPCQPRSARRSAAAPASGTSLVHGWATPDPTVTVAGHALEVGGPPDGERDEEVLVGIRAENIRIEVEPFPGALEARTRVVEPLGSHLLITADVGEQSIKVSAPPTSRPTRTGACGSASTRPRCGCSARADTVAPVVPGPTTTSTGC